MERLRPPAPRALALLLPLLGGCGAMLCTKGETRQGVIFDFWSMMGRGYLDLSHYPTFHSGPDGGAAKLIVEGGGLGEEGEGFLLVMPQGRVHCDNMDELRAGKRVRCKGHRVVDTHRVHRYTRERGYEEWATDAVPEEEWRKAAGVDHAFPQKPEFHYENCRYDSFAGVVQLFQTVVRI